MKDEAISSLLREAEARGICLQLDGGKLRLNVPKGTVSDQLKNAPSNRERLVAGLKSYLKVNSKDRFNAGLVARTTWMRRLL